MICNISDTKARIKYDEMHINVMPNVKFNFLLGFNICHKNGIANNKIGYAVKPSVRFTMVNQYAVMAIKYRYGTSFV